MCVCVCVCVCVSAYAHVCVSAYAHVCVHLFSWSCVYVFILAYVYNTTHARNTAILHTIQVVTLMCAHILFVCMHTGLVVCVQGRHA